MQAKVPSHRIDKLFFKPKQSEQQPKRKEESIGMTGLGT
jgi:hypothetical protein